MATPPEFQNTGVNIIQGYGPGRFRIGQTVHEYSLLVSAEHVSRWDISDIASVTPQSIDAFLNHTPPLEVIIFGTGQSITPIPQSVRDVLRQKRIGVDVMDTGAACRTYHVLLAEKRRVGVALLIL